MAELLDAGKDGAASGSGQLKQVVPDPSIARRGPFPRLPSSCSTRFHQPYTVIFSGGL